MSNRFGKFDCSFVLPDKCKFLAGSGIWLIKSVTDRAAIEVEISGDTRQHGIDQNRSVLIASTKCVNIVSLAGAWKFQKIPVFEASKLLAFLECRPSATFSGAVNGLDARGIVIEAPGYLNIWRFERWLIGRVVKGHPQEAGFLGFLRSQETYGLVRFLLAARSDAGTVEELSERYGLSASHFRRLCRRALGNGLKRELRQWRAATALLDVAEGRQSMTELAIAHGFASSSHFSREIKDLFGLSPRQFRRET